MATGSYRRPQGVLILVREYETLMEVYEQHLRRSETGAAVASVRAGGIEPAPAAIADVERAAEGEISYDEAKERMAARARQWRTPPTGSPGTGDA